MSHPEKIIKEFEEKFGDNAIYPDNWKTSEGATHSILNKFLLQTHLSYLLDFKKRLEGEIKDIPYAPETEQIKIDKIWNSALTQQIAVLEQEIKEVESLITNIK